MISRGILLITRNVSDKSCKEIQNTHTHTHYVNKFFFSESCAVYDIMRKNMVELDRPQMTVRPMRIACRITKATDTHSEYVVLTVLPLQERLGERCTYTACLIVRSWVKVLRHLLVEQTRSIWTDGRPARVAKQLGVGVFICGYN